MHGFMHDAAFLVGFLNKDKGTFEGCAVFSEPCPTVSNRLWPFTLAVGRGKDYADGLAALRDIITEPWWMWVRKHLDERSLGSLGITK